MTITNPEDDDFSMTECEGQLQRVQTAYDDVKEALLHAGAELRIAIPGMIDILEQNSNIRRMARQMYKAADLLSELHTVVAVRVPETVETVVQKK